MEFLKNQIAIVTGAGSGIGKAIALALAAEGASLCLVGRRLSSLDATIRSVLPTTSRMKSYRIDLVADDDIYKLGSSVQREFEGVDMLIHCAGAFSMGLMECASIENFDTQYRVNVRAPYLLTQILLPMIKSRHGQIVFVNSSVGLKAKAQVSQYAATKHALKAIADSLREEVNDDGVRVLSIYPGKTATPMQERIHKMEGKSYEPDRLMQPGDIAKVVINSLLLPRSAEVTDISIRPMNK
jgi:NADP-dependent 3-hydroxy acid dehydrogenase YdfG